MTDSETPAPHRSDSTRLEAPRRKTPARRRERTGRIQTGKVFGVSLGIWFRNVPAYTLIALFLGIPYAAANYFMAEQFDPALQTITADVASQLCVLLTSGVLISHVFSQIREQPKPIIEATRSGLSRLPSVIGLTLVLSAIFLLIRSPTLLGSGRPGNGLTSILFLAVSVVVTFVSCGVIAAVPSAVVENTGVLASIKRSWPLTKGAKWSIFLVLFLLGLFGMLLGAVLGAAMFAVFETQPGWIGTWIIVSVIGSLSAVFSTVIYHDLRVTKEGIASEDLASVFD